jgi:flavin reductase (DIM6/NTAB) family NADH-FMN oxidoreductase RutF
MQLDPRDNRDAVYKLLIGCVVPRPSAWVSTVDADGVNNLAPFSFFLGVCKDPPHIAFSSGPRTGARKDTVRNLVHTGDFVVTTPCFIAPTAPRSWAPSRSKASFWPWTLSRSA